MKERGERLAGSCGSSRSNRHPSESESVPVVASPVALAKKRPELEYDIGKVASLGWLTTAWTLKEAVFAAYPDALRGISSDLDRARLQRQLDLLHHYMTSVPGDIDSWNSEFLLKELAPKLAQLEGRVEPEQARSLRIYRKVLDSVTSYRQGGPEGGEGTGNLLKLADLCLDVFLALQEEKMAKLS